MHKVTFDPIKPFINLRTDPFVDQVTLRYRPRDPVDLTVIFGPRARWQMRDLACGSGSVSVRVQPDYLTVSASPVKVAHGVNAFPQNSNHFLLTTFLRELSVALSQLAAADVHLILDGIIRTDLTIMADVGDPAYAQLLYDLLRLILRCTKPGDADGHFWVRSTYDNSIIFGRYGGLYSVKLYRKSALLSSGLDPIRDRWIRIEVTVSGRGAAELLEQDDLPSLETILASSRRLFDAIASGFSLMAKQLRSSHRPSSPLYEGNLPAAFHAWIEHGFQPTMYPPQDIRSTVLAYRGVGIDLLQPPLPLRASDHLRPALRTTLADLLDPKCVTLVGPDQLGGPQLGYARRGVA